MSSQSNLNYVSTIEGADSSHCQASLPVSSASGSLRHYSLTDATQVCPLHGKLVDNPLSTVDAGKYLVCSVNCDKSKQTVKPTLHCPLPSCVASNPHVLSSYLGLPQRHCDDLMMLGPNEMLKFVRKAETETLRVTSGQNQTNRDLGRCFQNFQCEIRALRESNQRLSDDNQELRDLCCFLDDDRQKGRKLAREWQRFGRYTASVMRQEVAAYQKKLRELENKQQELIKDNLELKELCLYLDEERNQNLVCSSCGNHCRAVVRDDGDGSSSSTNADDLSLPSQFISGNHYRSEGRERLLEESIQRQRTVFNVQMMHYVRSLEQRMKQLEDEKKIFLQKLNETGKALPVNEYKSNTVWENDLGAFSGRPEAVVQALQVLEVREQLEQIQGSSQVSGVYDAGFPPVQHNEDEKVLMKETCNGCK